MRAFILGNSGELLDHDLSLLQGETVFGCNALPLRCPEIITHYVCLDLGMAFVPEIRALVRPDCKKYYSRLMWNGIYEEDNVNVYDTWPDSLMGFEISAEKVYGGLTVTFVMLQIAAALGYDELYLLGVDLGLPANGIQHIPEQEILFKLIREKNLHNPGVDKRAKDPDHVEFNKPIQARFIIARQKLHESGIQVFNLSKGGNLNCFHRKSFQEIINHQPGIVPEVAISN